MRRRHKIIIFGLINLIILVIFMCFFFKNRMRYQKQYVKVGIIDSYIPNEILQLPNSRYISLVSETDYSNKHGRNILSIIAEENENIQVCYACVLDKENCGKIDDIVKAIEWCIEQDVEIICMSFATLDNNSSLKNVIAKAIENDIIIVSSCINYSDAICYPAMYDGVISVSGVANDKASVVILDNSINIKVDGETVTLKGNSYTNAYVCGYISKAMLKGKQNIDKIIKKINKV